MLTLKIPPVLVCLLAMLCSVLLAYLDKPWHWHYPFTIYVVIILALIGMVFLITAVGLFKQHNTTIHPLHLSHTQVLVVSGVYRITRNPMYLGMLLLLIAVIVWLQTWLGWLVVPAFILYMNKFQIMPEEKYLGSKFGESYAKFLKHTRRWL